MINKMNKGAVIPSLFSRTIAATLPPAQNALPLPYQKVTSGNKNAFHFNQDANKRKSVKIHKANVVTELHSLNAKILTNKH